MEETIVINGTTYVRKDSATHGPIKIAVLDRGFVYVGSVEEHDDHILLTNASNIRKWGTTKGLGELVSGPTSDTVLDKVGTVKVPMRAVISLIDVDQVAWNSI